MDVWRQQDDSFFEQATIEMDGTMVETTGQCKAGMDISYKGIWGYHPLVLTLAETGEVPRIVNRSGNRPSQEALPVRRIVRLIFAAKPAFVELYYEATRPSHRPFIWTGGARQV